MLFYKKKKKNIAISNIERKKVTIDPISISKYCKSTFILGTNFYCFYKMH